MKTFKFDQYHIPHFDKPITLCLGFFDGVHLGHKKLINKAKQVGYKVALLSFNHIPAFVVGKIKNEKLLTTSIEKKEILKKLNVNYYLELNFDEDLANMSKEKFIELLKQINPKVIVCGSDYTFGKDKTGNVDLLKKFFKVIVPSFKQICDKKISSRNIVQDLSNGDLSPIKDKLGRFYSLYGTVVKGFQNGRKIDFPTANLKIDPAKVIPANGVYAGYCYIKTKKYKCIINIGTHPTISELTTPLAEVHILNFNENIYRKNIKVEFIYKLRDEKKFDSFLDLKKQLNLDKKKALEIL